MSQNLICKLKFNLKQKCNCDVLCIGMIIEAYSIILQLTVLYLSQPIIWGSYVCNGSKVLYTITVSHMNRHHNQSSDEQTKDKP